MLIIKSIFSCFQKFYFLGRSTNFIRIKIVKRHQDVEGYDAISLPSARTDLVTSTRQFQENVLNIQTALSTASIISLPKSIASTHVRSYENNVEL